MKRAAPAISPATLPNAVANQAYSVTFTVPDYETTTSWQPMPAFYEMRSDNSFASILAKSTVEKGATQITAYSAATTFSRCSFAIGGYTFMNPTVYANEGRVYQQQKFSYQYKSGSKYYTGYYYKTFYATAGFSGISFEDADDGVFFIEDGTSAIFRWKGKVTTYVSEGGTGTGGTGTGGTSTGGMGDGGIGTSMTLVTKTVNFAIVLSSDGSVTYAYGDCGGLPVGYQTVTYPANTANKDSTTSSFNHESSETASADMQDIVFGKSVLPSGMSFSNGVLSGTPYYQGTYIFAVKAYIGDLGRFLTKAYTLTVDPPPPPEFVITPLPLPNGKVGEAYAGVSFSVKNTTGYSINVAKYAETRQANSFVATGGAKLSFNGGSATQKIPFPFPCAGTAFDELTFYDSFPGFESNGANGSFSGQLFQSQFSLVDSDDGVYYSTDGSTFATFRWKGSLVSWKYDGVSGTSQQVYTKVNASVTFHADGKVVFAFGDCNGQTLGGQNFSGNNTSTGESVSYMNSSGGKGGSGEGGGSTDGETLTASTQDLVVTPCFPPGLTYDYSGKSLVGTPTAAGTYNIAVTAYIYQDGSTITTNLPLVIEAADGPVVPPPGESKLEIVGMSFPEGTNGVAYVGSIAFESDKDIIASGTLPTWATAKFEGTVWMVSGTPTAEGEYKFTMDFENEEGAKLEGVEIAIQVVKDSSSGGGGSGGGDDPSAGDAELKSWSPAELALTSSLAALPEFSVEVEPSVGATYLWSIMEKKDEKEGPKEPEEPLPASEFITDYDKATCTLKNLWWGTFELSCAVNGKTVQTWMVTVGEATPENHVWYVDQVSGSDLYDGLSYATPKQNVYAVNAVSGDEVRIIYFNNEFNYIEPGVRYIATNGMMQISRGLYGARLQNLELAADGSGYVFVNITPSDLVNESGTAIKIAQIPADGKLADYDTATCGGAAESSASSGASEESGTGGQQIGKFQINWGSDILWDGPAYLATNELDEVWIMRNVGYPAPVLTGQLPAAADAASDNPFAMTEGILAGFHLQGNAGGTGLHLYTRWTVDGVQVKEPSQLLYFNFTPTHDLVDGEVHRLVCYGSNEYHEDAIQAEWYFTVSAAPLGCCDKILRTEAGPFAYDLDKEVVGGTGVRTYTPTNEVPDGVTVSANGVISGTMDKDLSDKKVMVVISDEGGASLVVTVTFRLQSAGDEDFYLVSCTPDVEELDVYLGEHPKFEIVARSDSVNASDQNYLWFWNGTLKNNDPDSCTLGAQELDPNLEGQTLTLSVYGSATYGTSPHGTLLKQWRCTIRDREFGFKTTELADMEVGQAMQKALVEFYLPYQKGVKSLEVLRGNLPPGLLPYGTTIAGRPRQRGTYTFVLQATCTDGTVATRQFTLTVTGDADIGPHAWYIDVTGTKHGSPGEEGYNVTTVNAAIQKGLATGDEIYVYPGTYDNLDFFSRLKGVPVHVMPGTVTLRVNAMGSLDVSDFVLEDGATLAFEKGTTFSLSQDEMKTWGYPVRLAKLPSGAKASDYAVSGFPYPDYVQTPKIDVEGWLYLEKGLWQDTAANGSKWHLDLADKLGRRDAVVRDFTFTTPLAITSSGVIPGSVTFAGTTTLNDTTLQDAGGGVVKVVLASDADLTLAGPSNGGVLMANNTLEIKAGATIRTAGLGFNNRGLVLPATSEAKVNVVLTSALPQYSEMTLFRFYFGADDAAQQFNLTVPSNAENYRWVRWYGRLNLSTRPSTGDGDPGNLVWTGSDTLESVEAFGAINQEIGVSGDEAQYGSHGFSIPGKLYNTSRGETSTFNARGGTRELLLRSIRKTGSGIDDYDDTVDIGFAFPFGGKYYSSARIGSRGQVFFGSGSDKSIRLLGNSLLWTLDSEQTFCDVWILRGANSFTVRYGEFGSVTLTPDGVVRMAFGSDASLLYGPTVREPICCEVTGAEKFEIASNDYANQPDVIFTPSGVPALTFSGNRLQGQIDVPGTYTFDIKVVSPKNTTRTRPFTLTVTPAANRPELVSVAAPDAAADGIIRLAPKEKKSFSAVVSEGAKAKWTLQYNGTEETEGLNYELTAPENRPVNRLARVILTVEDATGKWAGTVRKSWWVAFTKSIACDEKTGIPSGLESSLLPGDELVLAAGTYADIIDLGQNTAAVTIRSATGNAADVVLDGQGAHRCFRQGEPTKVTSAGVSAYAIIPSACRNATLRNLTLLNGQATYDSIYLWSQGAQIYGVAGGAAFGGTFENCIIGCSTAVATGTVESYGGGVYGAKLTGCLIAQNTAMNGGGCSNCELYDCTVADNVASAAAGGVDGQCYVKDSIIRYNVRGNEENEYEPTYRPNRLVADVPTIVDSFTVGDPLFCNDYSLANGSPAAGKGAYPDPHAGDCLVRVEIVGGGTVSPYEGGKVIVANGVSQKFDFSGRAVTAVYLDDEKVADSIVSYTLSNVTANRRLRVVFAAETLKVGSTRNYKRITDALAAAADGDTIEVDEGTYQESVDVSGFVGKLTIRATGAAANTVIDGNGAGRCFLAMPEATNVKLVGFTLKNGYVTGSAGFGGGAYGGYLEDCVITNCVALGGKGGGAYKSRLVRCGLYGNRAGDRLISQSWFTGAWGGGAYGGYLNDCRVNANRICATNKPKSDGAGTYDAEVRNSFVWGNYADIDQTSYERTNNAKAGSEGVLVYTKERVPTQANLDARKTPIAVTEKVVYATHAAAVDAAPKQIVDIPSEVARKVSDLNAYADLFEIATVEEGGQYVNKPVLKEAVQEEVRGQIASVLTEDDSGSARTEFNVQKMEKTLTETTPGLYYALEFSSDLTSGSFRGERHLATGKGSVKLSATSLDTSSGFWRVNVYATPDGD